MVAPCMVPATLGKTRRWQIDNHQHNDDCARQDVLPSAAAACPVPTPACGRRVGHSCPGHVPDFAGHVTLHPDVGVGAGQGPFTAICAQPISMPLR